MTVGGVRLFQPVVPVVPDDCQPEPVHRGEGRRPGADDHPGSPQQESQERPITARRTVLGREHHHRFPLQVAPEPGGEGLSLMGRRHHDDGAARARQGGLDGLGQAQLPRRDHRDGPAVVVRRTCFDRPHLRRQSGPDRAWSLTVGQAAHELLTTVVRLPAELTRGRRLPGGKVEGVLVSLSLLRGGVPGRNRKTDDVGACSAAAGGDGLDESTRALRQDREVGDHSAQS